MISSQSPAEHNYKIVNHILAGIILCIFLYSALFSPDGGNHPVPSFYTQLTGEPSPSTGLSRSFSAIIRGDFNLANSFNPLGIQIFLFFVIQFCYRLTSALLIKAPKTFIKSYIIADILISTIAFYLVFSPLILFTIKLFRKSLVEYM